MPKIVYPFEFEDPAKVQRYVADGLTSPYSQAIYHTIEAMLATTDKAIDANIAGWSDAELRYYSVRAKVLRELLKLPEMAKEKLEQGEE